MHQSVPTRRQVLSTGLGLGTAGIAGCSESETRSTTDRAADPDFEVDTVAEGLTHPWGLAALPDGDGLLVTERPGRLQLVDPTAGTTTEIAGVPDVYASGQGGLLDVTVAPDSGGWVYLTQSVSNERGETTTQLSRARLDRAGPELTALETLYVARPFVESSGHFGSRVVVGPDEMLYVTVGDRQFKNFGPDHVAQDPSNDLGTTLRLAPDGSIPPDNPFVADPEKRDAVFSYGHRNAQGMAVHPETGTIWQTEHGERDGDEINIVEAGGNYGWPVASESCRYGTDDPVGVSHDERPDIVDPAHYWPCGSGGFAPSGLAFFTGDAVPAWQGDLFAGTLAGRYLGHFTVEGETVTEVDPLLDDRGWRIRAVEQAPAAGTLFVAVDARDAPIVAIRPTEE
ncbi:PQQ-dependent sugar dehydrogenase [Halococcoides cellulosivorans]|nr:PQQ-dependent sugar dehydrogenase [Halococcoides cellulosivorans]